MSLSISPSPAAPSSDGAVPSAANTKGDPNSLSFEAILDRQTDANGEEVDDVCDEDLPINLPATPAVGSPVTVETAIDPLAGPPSGLGFGVQRPRIAEDDVDAAVLRAIVKDTPANEAASLLLLAALDVLQRLELRQAAVPAGQTDSSSARNQTAPVVDDQLPQNVLVALVSAEGDAAPEAADVGLPTTADPATLVTDLLIKDAAQDPQSNQARVPDAPLWRPTPIAPAVALSEAIRGLTDLGTFADVDKGFNQPSTTAGFDRRNSKTAAEPAIHLAGAAGGISDAVKTAPSSIAAIAPLPNEDSVVSSIVQTMHLQMRDGIGTAVVRLEPDYLGVVSIALRVENGVVTASLHAENPQVRAWMEANEPLLRESLAGQGLSLDRLLVTDERIADEHASERRHQQEQKQQARQRPRRDDTTTFEVVV